MADKSFRRQEFSSLVAAGHALSRKASNPDFHIHNNYEIYIFLQGHVNYFVEQSCYQLKRGDILIFNNQEIHTVVNLKNEVFHLPDRSFGLFPEPPQRGRKFVPYGRRRTCHLASDH